MGSTIKVEKNGDKEYLKTNKESFQNSLKDDKSDISGSVEGSFGLFSAKVTAQVVNEHSSAWTESGKSLNEQVGFNSNTIFYELRVNRSGEREI